MAMAQKKKKTFSEITWRKISRDIQNLPFVARMQVYDLFALLPKNQLSL